MGALTGAVFLVGAGPGAADLLTLRGLRALRAADLLLCDELLPRNFLEDLGVAAAGKEVRWLGEGAVRPTQDEINRMMGDAALAGRTVARVKNGDPFVFGRGGEEADYLSGLGVPFEVIPGLSSSLAAPAAAGLEATRRGAGRSFAVATARLAGGEAVQDLPRAESLIVLMGAAVLAGVVDRLLETGWSGDTAAALIERGTLPWERRLEGRLSEIAAVAREAGLQSPAVLVVGPAAERRGAFRSRPRILFTGLAPARFRLLGDMVHWPALRVVADREGLAQVAAVAEELGRLQYEWVVFTSPAGVRSFFAAMAGAGRDARLLAGTRVLVAGAGTADELRDAGILADATPAEGGSAGILSAIGEGRGGRVLVVQGSHAPGGLIDGLGARGWSPRLLGLHRVEPHPELGRPLPEHDIIYFVSPSGVRAFQAVYGEAAFRSEIWCMGEATRRELAGLGHGPRAKVVSPHA